jgi:site-specific DNA-cytosine methylase
VSAAIAGTEPGLAGSYFSEICEDAILVATTNDPQAEQLGDVRSLQLTKVKEKLWENPTLHAITSAGVPCEDVSLLSAHRTGAHGERSGLRGYFQQAYAELKQEFGSRIIGIMECTRMTNEDRVPYDKVFGGPPYEICNSHFQPNTRPRWWWLDCEPEWPEGTIVQDSTQYPGVSIVTPPTKRASLKSVLESGWLPVSVLRRHPGEGVKATEDFTFACLTKHRPRATPMGDPRGIGKATEEGKARWKADQFAQAPYQYADNNMVATAAEPGRARRLTNREEERLMGYPADFTLPVRQHSLDPTKMRRARSSLLGNAWSLDVTKFILRAVGVI